VAKGSSREQEGSLWRHGHTSRSGLLSAYAEYRKYVQDNAPKLKGHTDDCVDLSMRLIVEFAASKGLPLISKDNFQVQYILKGYRQTPAAEGFHHNYTWNTKDEYLKAIQKRIDAASLWTWNTEKIYPGPEPGDLLLKSDHAAIVFATHQPGQRHPKAGDHSVLDYPGGTIAASQLNVLEYFRHPHERKPGPWAPIRHFDYLNHRGDSGKQKAELIYYASVSEPDLSSFEFRK
jgi:hypothetical protein